MMMKSLKIIMDKYVKVRRVPRRKRRRRIKRRETRIRISNNRISSRIILSNLTSIEMICKDFPNFNILDLQTVIRVRMKALQTTK